MAKLYFKYGAMSAGKSLELLKTADSYERQGKRVLVLTTEVDTRGGVGVVESRVGIEREATLIETVNVMGTIARQKPDVVLVDEAQFLEQTQVEALAEAVDVTGAPVICFGLKNTFDNRLFEGTSALMAYADSIEEIKAVCAMCDRKATMNLRLKNGRPVKEGDTVEIGGDDTYTAVCREHYKRPILGGAKYVKK